MIDRVPGRAERADGVVEPRSSDEQHVGVVGRQREQWHARVRQGPGEGGEDPREREILRAGQLEGTPSTVGEMPGGTADCAQTTDSSAPRRVIDAKPSRGHAQPGTPAAPGRWTMARRSASSSRRWATSSTYPAARGVTVAG